MGRRPRKVLMSKDTVYHREVLRRAADRMGVGIQPMRKHVKYYLQSLASFLTEADPERDVRVHNLGVIRVRAHEGHKGRKGFGKGDSGEEIELPPHRSLRLDPCPRVDNVMKASLKKFYDSDEYKTG